MDERDTEFDWKIAKDDQETTLQRYGHSCNVYDNNLIIFGGQRGSGTMKTKRIVLNDLWVYRPQAGTLDQILAKSCPDLRYGHSATIAGDFLVIYGGMNEMGEVLKDICIFDFLQMKWIKVEMTPQNKKKDTPVGMCFSSMVSVFYKGRKDNPDKDFFGKYTPNQNVDPFTPKHIREKIQDQDLVSEGCYMFGGLTEDNDIVNDLYILKILQSGTRFEWEKVENYNGTAPCERCHHYMEYFDFNNSIVVYGGRNDNQSMSSVLDDIHFLQVDTLTWIKVEFSGKKKVSARFSHACTLQDTKLVIFGGVGSNFGMEQSIETVEFDPEKFDQPQTNLLK